MAGVATGLNPRKGSKPAMERCFPAHVRGPSKGNSHKYIDSHWKFGRRHNRIQKRNEGRTDTTESRRGEERKEQREKEKMTRVAATESGERRLGIGGVKWPFSNGVWSRKRPTRCGQGTCGPRLAARHAPTFTALANQRPYHFNRQGSNRPHPALSCNAIGSPSPARSEKEELPATRKTENGSMLAGELLQCFDCSLSLSFSNNACTARGKERGKTKTKEMYPRP